MDGDVIRDIFVIGGGINGCGIARDAAGRGYSVVLAEMKDFASGTSSASTKLIHGGLRYLEHYEFRLVREALMEREVLWAMAPHVIWPMRFVLPFQKGGPRPAWLIRLGLFLYDYIGGRKLLPATSTVDLATDPAGGPLKKLFRKAFEYSDGWVDDARLVVLNARDAADRGADIRTGTKVVTARRENGHWNVETENVEAGARETFRARMLVNAAGPWIDKVLSSAFARNVTPHQRSLAFGICTAAGSAGMFLFAPLSQGLISAYGWSDSLVYLGVLMLLVPFFAIPLRGNASSGRQSEAQYKQSIGEALKEALGHKSYLLLVSGFFVCGYQVAFITAHFPAYIGDIGIDARYAVIALALIGFFNIIGSLSAGFIAQRYSKPYFLALIYLARSVAVTAFLLLPQTPVSVIVFAIVMGLLWLSTVPPTNALVAIMFGTRHLGLLGGIVFLSHQVGSFLGVWMGGYLYDRFGSYDPVWWLGVALGVFAAIVHWPIEERGVARPATA